MDKISVKNLTGQEIKEMIDDKIISIEELDCSALEKVLNFEIDMLCLGTGDMMTIRRCSELLNERNDSESMSKERIVSIIEKAKNEHITIVNKGSTPKAKAKTINRRKIIMRRIGLVAAIITLLLATTTIVAAAFGVNIFECISKIVRQDVGSEINVDSFTFYHNGEAKQYASIEEMIEQENLDIMYPTKWPEGVKFKKVLLNVDNNGNTNIHFVTDDVDTYIFIKVNYDNPIDNREDSIIYECDGAIYYIFDDKNFYALSYYDNCCYSIQAQSYDELILIIKSMEYKK